MKCMPRLARTAIWLAGASVYGAAAAERCVAYRDENTDFTWRLCPGGEKYERQYLYFGVWSNFHRGCKRRRSLQVVAGAFELDLS